MVFESDDHATRGLAFCRKLFERVAHVAECLTDHHVARTASLQFDDEKLLLVLANREDVDGSGVGGVLPPDLLGVLLEDDVVLAKLRPGPVLHEGVLEVLLERE